MKLSEFKFGLPNNLIANRPAENRDESRLMVIHKDSGKIEHKIFKDIVGYFEEGDVLIAINGDTQIDLAVADLVSAWLRQPTGVSL